MIGLMQIMIYMLAVYLVYKGVEIFQIALAGNRETRIFGLALGAIMIVIALAAGLGFCYWSDSIAKSINDQMKAIPQLPGLQNK